MTKIKRVYLEITDVCNLNCSFCTNEKGHSFMDLAIAKIYLQQIKEVCDYVYLHVLGEPTIHPDFDEILNECDRLSLHVQLVTNGTLLDKYPDLLNHSCLRKLSISLHSINNTNLKENYFSSILNLLNMPTKTTIELRFYDFNNLDSDLKTLLKRLENTYGLKVTDKINSYCLKENVYVYLNDLFDWPNINDKVLSTSGKCKGAINQIAILHDGRVTTCCLDPKGHNCFGDLKKNSLSEILQSKLYLEMTNKLQNAQLSFELCTKCSYRTRFK